MARRVSLPAADDLFRPTVEQAVEQAPQAGPDGADQAAGADRRSPSAPGTGVDAAKDTRQAAKRPSGRVRHDEKMTVYITSEELLEIEHARLSLRRSHGLAVDRGRLVREAVALALADLEANGDDSALVERLRQG